MSQQSLESFCKAGEATRQPAQWESSALEESHASTCSNRPVSGHAPSLPGLELTNKDEGTNTIKSVLSQVVSELSDRRSELAEDYVIGRTTAFALRTPAGMAIAGGVALGYLGVGLYTGKFTVDGTVHEIKNGLSSLNNALRDMGTVFYPNGHTVDEVIAARKNTSHNLVDIISFEIGLGVPGTLRKMFINPRPKLF